VLVNLARSLVSQLAVLRRPATAADRLPGWAAREALAFPAHGRLLDGLSRLANGYAGTDIYLVVETPMHATHAHTVVPCCLVSPRLGDLIDTVALSGRRFAPAGDHPEPAPALRIPLSTRPDFSQGGAGDVRRELGLEVGVVPDGVRRVRWTFAAGPGRSVTVAPSVAGNVAVAGNVPARAKLVRAVWSGSRGRVITVLNGTNPYVQRAATQRAAIAASDRERVAGVLLRRFGVLRTRSDLARTTPGAALSRSTILSLIQPNPLGLNVGLARFVPYPGIPGGSPAGVWVVPGRLGAALLAGPQSISETDALVGSRSATSGWFRIDSVYGDGSRNDAGLVPDGYTRVAVQGTPAAASVVQNVYSINVPAHARALVITGPGRPPIRIPVTGLA
jgi:hypothetical protein